MKGFPDQVLSNTSIGLLGCMEVKVILCSRLSTLRAHSLYKIAHIVLLHSPTCHFNPKARETASILLQDSAEEKFISDCNTSTSSSTNGISTEITLSSYLAISQIISPQGESLHKVNQDERDDELSTHSTQQER